jgi:ketosteroid isomerase-like protein
MPLQKPIFSSPQDAEAAFYDALQRGDLEAFMSVWAEDEEIVCILPGGPRLAGYASVRETWRRIFETERRFSITISQPIILQGMLVSVHNLHEQINLKSREAGQTTPVLATNVYIRGALGWRLLVHHASSTLHESPGEISKTLH